MMLIANCTSGAMVWRTSLGVNGQALYMLWHINCIQCPVVEALMPELEDEWCDSSCVAGCGAQRAGRVRLRNQPMHRPVTVAWKRT